MVVDLLSYVVDSIFLSLATFGKRSSLTCLNDNIQGLTSAAVKKGGLYSLDVGSQYKYKNTFIDVKVDTSSNVCFLPLPYY